ASAISSALRAAAAFITGYLGNTSIRTKLSLALGTALTLIVVVGLFGLAELRHVNNATLAVRSIWVPKIEAFAAMRRAVEEHRSLAIDRMQITDARQAAALNERLNRTWQRLADAEKALVALWSSGQEQAFLVDYQQ